MTAPKPIDYQTLRTLMDGKKPSVFKSLYTLRAKVPGGWLVAIGANHCFSGVTFYPDPQHKWDGASLD